VPQWTTQTKIEGGGRYALGLNGFHDGLEEILIKGIIAAANRLRHITYCCWAIGDIENNVRCEDYAQFVDAFTLRENALALGFSLTKPDHTVYGSTVTSRIVKETARDYDCSFRLMQSNELGAYGLYYAGTIYNWGLTATDDKGIPQLTPSGKKLYDIIDKKYRQISPDYYRRYKGKKKVPTAALSEWAEINNYNNIREERHTDEREFFKTTIFRLDKKETLDYRRATFALVMECIDQCAGKQTLFTEDILRNIHYYGHYCDDSGRVRKFIVPKYLDDVNFYWCIYEGHVYFRGWLSKYFQAFLDHLKSCSNGSTIDDFFDQIDPKEFNGTIKYFFGKAKNYYDAQMASILDFFSQPSSFQDNASEEALKQDYQFNSLSGLLAKFVLVMANLYAKFKTTRSDRRYQYLAVNLSSDLSLDVLYSFVNLERMPVREFLKIMLKRHIINQHDNIMIEKKDLRRSWFTTENNRYYHQADESILWRQAKYDTIMNFLTDLKLIKDSNGLWSLSGEGNKLYSLLKKDYF